MAPEVAANLPGARLQGRGTLRVLFFSVYDAQLWCAAQAVPAQPDGAWVGVPLALQIDYTRAVAGSDIAEHSLTEMQRQQVLPDADAAAWLAQLRDLFPDVKPGDRLTAIQRPAAGVPNRVASRVANGTESGEADPSAAGGSLRVFFNGMLRGRVDDPRLARLFIGIWLSPQTSQPALRAALLGAAAPVASR